ncbi:MAG TPA: MoxR family ATPase [Clostridiales bacterium]|nr:MoxR family ATPase [Clostridiales bacterium]
MSSELNTIQRLINNVEKAIVGKRKPIELVVLALVCKGHVLLEDVPGVGKTSLVSALAKSINGTFKRIQFTPDVLPSDITGFSMYNKKTDNFEYRSGAVMCNFLLADEINRTSPKTQSSLLEVMQEYQVTVDGVTYAVPKPFMVIATQNPIEYLGTYPLPEAQLDRFFMKVSIGYPSNDDEKNILKLHAQHNPIDSLECVASIKEILNLQDLVPKVYTDERIYQYIISLVSAVRSHPNIELGPSPRASIALHRAAQAHAMFKGRDYVVPDDVLAVVKPVLSHRIILNREAKMRDVSQDEVLSKIIMEVSVPGTNY